jgi:hypothetical protein
MASICRQSSRKERLKVVVLWIREASLPLPNRPPGDTSKVGQSCLCQPDTCPQCQHQLTESVVLLSIPRQEVVLAENTSLLNE